MSLVRLPCEILETIADYTDVRTVAALGATCRSLHAALRVYTWRRGCARHWPDALCNKLARVRPAEAAHFLFSDAAKRFGFDARRMFEQALVVLVRSHWLKSLKSRGIRHTAKRDLEPYFIAMKFWRNQCGNVGCGYIDVCPELPVPGTFFELQLLPFDTHCELKPQLALTPEFAVRILASKSRDLREANAILRAAGYCACNKTDALLFSDALVVRNYSLLTQIFEGCVSARQNLALVATALDKICCTFHGICGLHKEDALQFLVAVHRQQLLNPGYVTLALATCVCCDDVSMARNIAACLPVCRINILSTMQDLCGEAGIAPTPGLVREKLDYACEWHNECDVIGLACWKRRLGMVKFLCTFNLTREDVCCDVQTSGLVTKKSAFYLAFVQDADIVEYLWRHFRITAANCGYSKKNGQSPCLFYLLRIARDRIEWYTDTYYRRNFKKMHKFFTMNREQFPQRFEHDCASCTYCVPETFIYDD